MTVYDQVFDGDRLLKRNLRIFKIDGIGPGFLLGLGSVGRPETGLSVDVKLQSKSGDNEASLPAPISRE